MRTAEITLNGVKYPMCFSLRVTKACEERYGGIENIDAALRETGAGNAINEVIWLLRELIGGGVRYSKRMGIETPETPDADELLDTCDISDFAGLKNKIIETMSTGRTPGIEVEVDSKNAAAAPAAD